VYFIISFVRVSYETYRPTDLRQQSVLYTDCLHLFCRIIFVKGVRRYYAAWQSYPVFGCAISPFGLPVHVRLMYVRDTCWLHIILYWICISDYLAILFFIGVTEFIGVRKPANVFRSLFVECVCSIYEMRWHWKI